MVLLPLLDTYIFIAWFNASFIVRFPAFKRYSFNSRSLIPAMKAQMYPV
jgi:hypothetical protein